MHEIPKHLVRRLCIWEQISRELDQGTAISSVVVNRWRDRARLYGMMGLQVVYFALQAHGWYCWKYGIHRTPARISHVPRREALILALLGVPSTLILASYLRHIGGVMILSDAFTTVFSLIVQYMLNLKRIANWALGVVLDVVVSK